MRITFLGTGSPTRVPVYGCTCPACTYAKNNYTRRYPSSILVETETAKIMIDAGLSDLAERFAPGELTSILLTHYHVDHVQGLFDLRWGKETQVLVCGPEDPDGCADLYRNPGILDFSLKAEPFHGFSFGDLMIVPVPLVHSRMTLGYALDHNGNKVAYLTDTCGLSEEAERFLSEWRPQTLIIDCSYPPEQFPDNHNSLEQVQEIHESIQPERTYLTHIGHDMDAWLLENELPDGIIAPNEGDILEP